MLHPQTSNFKYCLDTYVIRDKGCIGHCCNDPSNLAHKIEIAKLAGFDAVELWHQDVEGFLNLGLTFPEIKVPSYKVIQSMDDEKAAAVLRTAAAVNAQSCVVKLIPDEHVGPIPDLKVKFKNLLKIAEEFNIRLGVEFMALAPFGNSLRDAWNLVLEADHPLAGIVIDAWHLWRRNNENFDEFAEMVSSIDANKITAVHFTDARSDIPRIEQVDGDREMPGKGVLNLPRLCGLLSQIGYTGYLSLNVYDQRLWNSPPLAVATEGHYQMLDTTTKWSDLTDSLYWKSKQRKRCSGLWAKQYLTHLDPRIKQTDREQILTEILEPYLQGKKVVDFKCGFSPLHKFVSVGFDAFSGCADYLRQVQPDARWLRCSDEEFVAIFDEKIDVLMHLGFGDSETEIDSHLRIREKCQPDLVIFECAATPDGQVKETKPGQRAKWERLKEGLQGEERFYATTMYERSERIMFIGTPNKMSFSTKPVKITAKEEIVVTTGTPLTNIKDRKGTNHDDLGLGALLNFFCWPEQVQTKMQIGETKEVPPFTAFKIEGEADVECEDQTSFFVPR